MIHVKLLFFATLRERAGTKSMDLEIPDGTTVRGLRDMLARDHPALKPSLETVLISINREYAENEAVVPPNAEVALFPPVSGGTARSRLPVPPRSSPQEVRSNKP